MKENNTQESCGLKSSVGFWNNWNVWTKKD